MIDDVIIFFVITFLKFLNFFVNWMQLPYYNSMIDGIQLFKEVVIANVYLIASLLGILGNHKGKISFDILFVLTMLGLIFAFYRVRKMQLERVFLKLNKGPKDIKMQLVAFVRLCHEKKLHMVVQLQTWIL